MARPAFPKIAWSNNGKISDPFRLDGNQVIGFFLPSSIASTSISFKATPTMQISSLTVPWYPVWTSAGLLSFTVSAAAANYYGFTQDQTSILTGVEFLQMVAASSEMANQDIRLAIIPRQY